MANKQIWKFPLELGPTHLRLPRGGSIQAVGYQEPQLVCWAEVDPMEPYEMVPVNVVGTGWYVDSEQWQYVGTTQARDFVWHLYRQREG